MCPLGGYRVTFVSFFPAQNPEIQTTAQEEVDRVLGDSDVVTADMDKELKYVGNCIKESQRLIPALTGFSRGVAQDSELGGNVLFFFALGEWVRLGRSLGLVACER